MKKSLVIIAIVFGFMVTSVNAKPATEIKTTSETSFVNSKVNAFCLSVIRGDVETVKKLISYGVDVNQKSNGKAPLHYAAKYNRADVVKLLVKNGAKMNVRCDKGYTVMKYAKLSNAKDVIAVLEKLDEKKRKA